MNDLEKIDEWDENVNISWWKEGRIKLNKVIRKYNDWIDNPTDLVKTCALLEKINKHLRMHYCNQDGGDGYQEELLKMKYYVLKILNK